MRNPRSWPNPADLAAARRLVERFAAQSAAAAALSETPSGRAMLEAIGGGSPFLSDLAVREHACVVSVMAAGDDQGPDHAVAAAMDALARTSPAAPRAHVAAAMRRAKRQVALAVALADIGDHWGLAQVTAAMSRLAEAALGLALSHLLLAAHAAKSLVLPDPSDPQRDCGLVVLGMGKLGARELNYSSDIDFILLYDPDAHPNPDTLAATFTRIARDLVLMMEKRDADGYVFRTDLRLRPDPAATPPAVSLPAALAYYESLGQNWERAAMTKARPIAGDIPRGQEFLAAIRPFVWRRQLDFAAIADLHAMKRRIDAHRGIGASAPGSLAGLDLKLGPGGIREIEFAAQTLQLVYGGRDPALRRPTTLGALRALVRAGRLGRRASAELAIAYYLLRRVEHRLQMVADRQTHALPDKPEAFARFAVFLGCDSAAEASPPLSPAQPASSPRDARHAAAEAALAALLAKHMARVRARYAAVFEAVPAIEGDTAALDLAGPDLPEATVAQLRAMGFQNPASIIGVLRGWQAGRLRALRSSRARELLDAVAPALLQAFGKQADPDAAFLRFDAMLSRQAAGVQLLSMFQRNPFLLERIAAVLGAAPMLADHLAQTPSALEGLLAPPGAASADILPRQLTDARALEDVIAIAARTIRAEEFRLSCAQLSVPGGAHPSAALDVDAAGLARTALADAALQALLPAVLQAHAARYGTVRGGDVAVVALGKAGSQEMMPGSDLDLMFLYAYPPRHAKDDGSSGIPESDGPRPIPASQWFIRAAHAFIAALTAPGAAGPLYAADMRLRPSGNKGPVAVSLESFARYHAESAWTWERMALTRARVVAGRPAIRARAEHAIAAALRRPHDPAQTLADAAAMRQRLARSLPPASAWDTKLRPGGGMEVEFIAQALQLAHRLDPAVQNTALALRRLADEGVLPPGEAQTLIGANQLWRTVQTMLRLTVGRSQGPLPQAAAAALLQAASALPRHAARDVSEGLDLAALDARLDAAAHAVRAIFNRRIGDIG